MAEHTYSAKTYAELSTLLKEKEGFVRTPWCADEESEVKVKEELKATTRCLCPDRILDSDICAITGKKATCEVIWGKAY